jgi:hypothetical protein
MTNRMSTFEEECKHRACPRCRQKRLIPRKPKDYNKLRCLNCGQFLTILREKT